MTGLSRRYHTSQAALTVGVAVLALILAACSKDDPRYKPGTLPPLSPTETAATNTPSPTPSGTNGMSDKRQVEAVYREFLKNFPSAQDVPKARRRTYLAQWMTDPGLSSMVEGINKQASNHERIVGTYLSHIKSIRVQGRSATVNDCVDQSKFNVKDTRTGKVVSEGPDRVWTVVYLKQTDAGWRVSDPTWRHKPCGGK